MSDIKRKYNVSAKGLFTINNERLYISVEDLGDVALHTLLKDFDGKEVKLQVNYDEDYEEPEVKVDPESGEILE